MAKVANIQDSKLSLGHDGKISIATAASRFETNWKNKNIMWSSLVKRLERPTITNETYAEYLASPKAKQDKIKDVGGFVGGSLAGGRRNSTSVISRQLLTLDLDFADYDVFDTIDMMFDFACCLYSTHKHSKKTPRYRLLVPLNREVSPDEYEAIARRIADEIDIEMFDDTSYQPSRLMYWPSVSRDGEYVYKYLDRPFLKADDVLNTYEDWHDTSFWPTSSRVAGIIRKATDKQGDPCEKPGIVGAFCRTYSITEAIGTFLSDVYSPTNREDRYTYNNGSTAAGLVIYEDGKFAYSNHSTDPAGGQLCNAFDLVRLHKFGEDDYEAPEGTTVTKLPSYKAMCELASEDKNVRSQIAVDKIESALEDFINVDTTEGDPDAWMGELAVTKEGNIKNTSANIALILANDPNIKGIIGTNEFDSRICIMRKAPWRDSVKGECWTDVDDNGITSYVDKTYGIYAPTKVLSELSLLQANNKIHPVKDYLNSLKWDCNRRVDTLFIDYFGAEDTPYTRACARKMCAAAVARVMSPGVKFDNMVVLIGSQGIGKSQFFYKLSNGWFTDSLSDVRGKNAYETIHGSWIVEMGELGALKRAEVEDVKSFISAQQDTYRPAYGRRTVTYKRQNIFVGTTNEERFLKDSTGNRRFWPIMCGTRKPKLRATRLNKETVDQIWAEAVVIYLGGEKLYMDDELLEVAMRAQEEHEEVDGRQEDVDQFVNMDLPVNWYDMDIWQRRSYIRHEDCPIASEETMPRERVCPQEIWVELFGKSVGDMKSYDTRDINRMLDKVKGWEKYRVNGKPAGLVIDKSYGYRRCHIRSK